MPKSKSKALRCPVVPIWEVILDGGGRRPVGAFTYYKAVSWELASRSGYPTTQSSDLENLRLHSRPGSRTLAPVKLPSSGDIGPWLEQGPTFSPTASLIGASLIETLLAELGELAEAKITHPGGEQEDARGHKESAQAQCTANSDGPEVIGKRSRSKDSKRINELS